MKGALNVDALLHLCISVLLAGSLTKVVLVVTHKGKKKHIAPAGAPAGPPGDGRVAAVALPVSGGGGLVGAAAAETTPARPVAGVVSSSAANSSRVEPVLVHCVESKSESEEEASSGGSAYQDASSPDDSADEEPPLLLSEAAIDAAAVELFGAADAGSSDGGSDGSGHHAPRLWQHRAQELRNGTAFDRVAVALGHEYACCREAPTHMEPISVAGHELLVPDAVGPAGGQVRCACGSHPCQPTATHHTFGDCFGRSSACKCCPTCLQALTHPPARLPAGGPANPRADAHPAPPAAPPAARHLPASGRGAAGPTLWCLLGS